VGHNYSQIYILDSNNKSSNTKIANEENITNNINNQVSLYNYINSTGKHMHPIKSTPDIASSNNNTNNVQKSSQISSLSNNINKINGLQNLNLNSISNNNTNAIESNSNTNRTSNKTIHFRSNSNLYNNINNSKEASDIIYKKKLSVKQKDVKSSSLHSNRSNSQIEDDTSNTKIKSARGLMPKQETIKAKLVKNLLPFSNYQSPVEKKQKKIINNYMIDSKKIREGKLLNKGPDADSDIYNHENKSTSLINNNYYIGINLDKKIINNICHTFRENNNYFNCNLISNNNEAQEISSDNRNLKIINDTNKTSKINNLINNETNINNNDTLKDNKKKCKYFNSNSQEFIKGFTKKNTTEKLTIEINKRENEKKKLFIDNKIRIKQKDSFEENKYPNDMLYIPPNKELKQETVHLTTTTSLDCYYYKNEKEKLYKFIRQYYSEHKAYPDTQKHFYLYGRQIGHGAFGKVNIALHVASGRLVAIKSFNKKNLKKKNAKQKINNEIEMLSRLRHPFISQILDSFETETHIFIVMEYICGDLLGFIRKRGKLSETVSKIIFKQLIEGLKYIHKKKIVHRDIKLDNILIDLTNTIKICDFGVSRKISKDEIMHEHCGTPAYIAPEIFENNGYTGFQCDIWSAGVTLYYILGGIQPFRASSIKDLEKKVIAGDFEPIEEVSEEANNLIKLMLKTDPKKRINEDKILNHPWLVNIKTENRKKLNLFTEAEKILLSKYDVDYLTSDKEELIENFTMKNLETNENENIKNAVGGTKSVIYAPYNTYIEPNEDQSIYKSFIEVQKVYKEIEIHNDICKYGFKVQQANIKYELSNNQDFDNGIIKTQKDEDLKHQNEKIEKIAFKGNNSNNLFYNKNYTEKWNDDSYEDEDSIKINEKIVNDIEKTVGYDKNYVINCLKKNVINYATATYYLLARENNNEDNNMYGNFV
jgi:serine/threonine protein kinase